MSELVKIKEIEVEGLFGHLNNKIVLSDNEQVDILTAPNGFGKTTIFRMIDFIFNPTVEKYMAVKRTPFIRFIVKFSNGSDVSLERKGIKGREVPLHIAETLYEAGEEEEEETIIYTNKILLIFDGNKKEAINLVDIFEDLFVSEDGDRVSLEMMKDYYSYSIRSILDRRESFRIRRRLNAAKIDQIKSFVEILNEKLPSSKLLFIPADRLHSNISGDRMSSMIMDKPYSEEIDTLRIVSRRIANMMTGIKYEYSKLFSEARNEVPKLYLKGGEKKNYSNYDEFIEAFRKYIDSLEEYARLGILDEENSLKDLLNDENIESMFDEKKDFLEIYLSVYSEALKPLEKYYQKIKLFTEIFNARNSLTHKSLNLSKGRLEILSNGRKIDPKYLSSGEKNDLVMFYYLIFEAKEGDIILIDEPEISLHISWQEEYIDNLEKICGLENLQALVATHSPHIIGTHMDLVAQKELTDIMA